MHQTNAPMGEIRGRAVVRDQFGNVKSTFEFGGPATEEQFHQLKDSLKEAKDGSHTYNGGP